MNALPLTLRMLFAVTVLAVHTPASERRLEFGKTQGTVMRVMDNAQLGITWTNSVPPEKYSQRQNLMNGAGVALGDYDGDGLCDIFLCSQFTSSALYRNLGNWRFEDVTTKAGVSCAGQISTGAAFADYDGDGRLDLFVASFLGPNACFRNLGAGAFTNVTDQVGLRSPGGATSLALGDLDGDGDLDLYVCYFAIDALLRDGVSFSTRMVGGQPVVAGRYGKRLRILNGTITEFGEPDIVYRNDGGKFVPLKWEEFFSDESGRPMPPPSDFSLAVQIRDINLDGHPDIYTCSDFQTPDRCWLNDGKGHFRAIEQIDLRNRSYASMGVDFADIDRDGDVDFITVEMLSRTPERAFRQSSPMPPMARVIGKFDQREDVARNGLYINRGDGTYAELAWFGGVAASDWSWTPIFVDVDLDGYEDILISNGHLHDVNDRDWAARTAGASSAEKKRLLKDSPRLAPPKMAFRNRGNLTFEDRSGAWGFNSTAIVHGMALADLDGDGDLDVVGNAVNRGPLIYRNDSDAPRVAVRLRGKGPNTHGIGARIELRAGGMVQSQEIVAGGRYLSSDDTVRVFALAENSKGTLDVRWRSGARTRVDAIKANTLYLIDESESEFSSASDVRPPAKPMFEDVTDWIAHSHQEPGFDDFEHQPLLPRRYSQLGPGLSWFDLDGDGNDELIIGSGRGGTITVIHTGSEKQFFKRESLGPALEDDSTTVLGAFLNGVPTLLAGISQYESGKATQSVKIWAGGKYENGLGPLPENSSPGALSTADFDGDGDLDLFVAGRIIPGNFPAAPSSALYRCDAGKLVIDEKNSAVIQPSGMISAAVFSDLNSDGFPELITAEEWGPVRIYLNDRGTFSQSIPLESSLGFWNSVTTGDLNNDGKLDIVAGNLGQNNRIARGASFGQWVLYYDVDPAVSGEIVEAWKNTRLVPMRDLQTLRSGMPSLAGKFPNHEAFATADLAQVLSEYWTRGKVLKAETADTCVFWNDGQGKWRREALPGEAQWAPAFGLNIADFDNDTFEDLFVAQNFFAVRPEDERQDAGRGLLLKGNGAGALLPLSGSIAGITIYGEQRGSATCDFDLDGRLDLAVAQNGAATKLYRNTVPSPGLRVRLKGPAGNPLGVGAIIRPNWAERAGPAREVHAGSGYWSQDSAVQIFAAHPKEISVLWPGGKRTVSKVPENAREIQIDASGNCAMLN